MSKAKSKTTESTLIYLLLDTSASMTSKWRETVMALESYVVDQQSLDEPAAFAFAQFDSPGNYRWQRFDDIRGIKDPASLAPPSPDGGSTALLDATMTALGHVGADQADKRALVILTDGEENASQEYAGRGEEVRAALNKAEAADIALMFLAVGPDAWANDEVFRHLTVRVGDTPQAAASSMAYASRRSKLYRDGTVDAMAMTQNDVSVDDFGVVHGEDADDTSAGPAGR